MLRSTLPVIAAAAVLILLMSAGMHWLPWGDGGRFEALTREAGDGAAARADRVPPTRPIGHRGDTDAKRRARAAAQRPPRPSPSWSIDPFDSVDFVFESYEGPYRTIGEPLDAEDHEAAAQEPPLLAFGEVLDADAPQGTLWEQDEGEVVHIGVPLDAGAPQGTPWEQAEGEVVHIGLPFDADAPLQEALIAR